MAETFEFEHTHRFTEREFAELLTLMSKRPPRLARRLRLARQLLFVAVAVACLLWSYTFLLGILLLLLLALSIWAPHTIRGTAANLYRESKFLSTRMTYGVSDSRLWARGTELSAEAGWRYLGAWRIRSDWLILPCEGIPTVHLPVRALQEAGIYEQVLALVRAHGTEFDRPIRAR
jgi:hypothetical protein